MDPDPGVPKHMDPDPQNTLTDAADTCDVVYREDLLLLDAVEMFGYGNWKDVTRHVESKTEQQVKERYIKRFINGSIGVHTWKEDHR